MVFDEGPGSPGVSDGSNNRLRARVDMDVLNNNPLLLVEPDPALPSAPIDLPPTTRDMKWACLAAQADLMLADAGCGARPEFPPSSLVELAGHAHRCLTPLLSPICEAITLTQVINAQRLIG